MPLKRGDQVIFGAAYQRDDVLDQFGTRNLFSPTTTTETARAGIFDGTGCTEFCTTVLPDQQRTQWVITAGYRRRVLRWLGLQVRGAYYDGETVAVISPGARELYEAEGLAVPEPQPLTSSYWNISAGLVINVQALQ